MSLQKVQKHLLCTAWRNIKNHHILKASFKTTPFVLNDGKQIPGPPTLAAGEFLGNILDGCKTGSIFAGTGQYYQEKEQDRILVLNLAEDFITDQNVNLFDSKTILDCSMAETDVDLFMKNIRSVSHLPVYNGEVDFINTSLWQHGFTLRPFSIFSGDERVLLFKDDLLCISSGGITEEIDADSIEYVGLWVSDEPYNERKLLLGLKDQPNKTLIKIETNDADCDLAKLTVSTEWMMKAAALLCVNLTRKGNETVHLRVSPFLQPANNEWVAMRQKAWIHMIQKNSWENDA